MKKTKVLLIILLTVFISAISFSNINAHSIDLDPNNLISFPYMVFNGKVSITIKSSEEGYSLYYQTVEIPNATYSQIEKIRNDGEEELNVIDAELDNLKEEADNLKTIYNEAAEAYKNATEEQKEQAKEEYDIARENYQNKVTEYNNKTNEYNTKVEEVNAKVKELTPTYVEDNWAKAEEDDTFTIDLSKFSGEKVFAIWVKLVSADGTVSYDESIYTMSGTKPEEVKVESISLSETTLEITEGNSYTITATIKPTDATNKEVVWSSDNEKVAKVENGKITAIAEGTATITATTEDGDYTATCKVTVSKKTTDAPSTDDSKKDETDVEDKNVEDTDTEDTTTAKDKLPQTGSTSYIIVLSILIIAAIGFIAYKKIQYLNFK